MSNRDDRGVGTRPGAARRRVVRLRATVGRIAAAQVVQLRLVAAVAADCEAAARRELAGVPREWGTPSVEELTHSTVIHELCVTLGIAKPGRGSAGGAGDPAGHRPAGHAGRAGGRPDRLGP